MSIEELMHRGDLGAEIRRQRIRDEARDTVRRERAETEFTRPTYLPTLADELAAPIEHLLPRIAGLGFVGQNTLIAAKAKAGKTTLSVNIIRALADGEPFLGAQAVTAPQGRVGYINAEMSQTQANEWFRSAGIRQPDRIAVLHTRGHRLPLVAPVVQDFYVEWAAATQVEVLIADPWGRMMAGSGSENSNDDVRAVLEILGEIKRRAGIADLLVIAHMGHTQFELGQERARGASELLGWPDAIWNLTEQDGTRFLNAYGRDVDFPEQALAYDISARRLTIAGAEAGASGANRTQHRRQRGAATVAEVVRDNPGINSGDLHNALTDRGWTNAGQRDEARKAALRDQLVHDVKDGRSNRFYPGPSPEAAVAANLTAAEWWVNKP